MSTMRRLRRASVWSNAPPAARALIALTARSLAASLTSRAEEPEERKEPRERLSRAAATR